MELSEKPAPVLVMIHSPLVGPAIWRRCGDLLQRKGCQVRIPSLADLVAAGPPYYENIAQHLANAARNDSDAETVVLVAHSGAGALLPAVAKLLDRQCYGIFVDAILPHPGQSWLDAAPPQLSAYLRSLVCNGYLPPWHQWFPPEVVLTLIPDLSTREQFIVELPQIPFAYLEERASSAGSDRLIHCGYIQLSDGYGVFADEAEKAGWITLRESADHLAVLTRPQAVCNAIVTLLKALGFRISREINQM